MLVGVCARGVREFEGAGTGLGRDQSARQTLLSSGGKQRCGPFSLGSPQSAARGSVGLQRTKASRGVTWRERSVGRRERALESSSSWKQRPSGCPFDPGVGLA